MFSYCQVSFGPLLVGHPQSPGITRSLRMPNSIQKLPVAFLKVTGHNHKVHDKVYHSLKDDKMCFVVYTWIEYARRITVMNTEFPVNFYSVLCNRGSNFWTLLSLLLSSNFQIQKSFLQNLEFQQIHVFEHLCRSFKICSKITSQ